MHGWDGNNDWMWHSGHGLGWGGWISAVLALVVIALVIAGVVVAVRYLTRGQSGRGAGNTAQTFAAENILAERLARGEIDDAEFQQRMATLRGQR